MLEITKKFKSLKLIGEGPLLAKLKNEYKSDINIKFLGSLDNKVVLDEIYGSKGVITATKLYEDRQIPEVAYEWGTHMDGQVNGSYSIYGDQAADTLLITLQPIFEKAIKDDKVRKDLRN